MRTRNAGTLELLSCAALAGFGAAAQAQQDPSVIVEWNQLLQENGPPAPPFANIRVYAIMHIAMFEAVNSIEGRYTPYRMPVDGSSGASPEAAAAQAAHDVLVAALPAAADIFDAALDARLDEIPRGRARQGAEVGRQAAESILDWRADDGYSEPNVEYVLPELPGLWRPTAENQVAGFANVGDVEPFALLTPTQYLPDRPPSLTSAEYAAAFDEVKEIGSATSATRTPEQTETARLWAVVDTSTTPFAVWNNVARDVARERGWSLGETARAFALLNAAIHDGLQTAHTSKFVYGLWRPVTAVRLGDDDLNPDTTGDPVWEPLLVTPPYPSHASNMACIGAAAAQTLARLFDGNDVPITVNWAAAMGSGPGVTRHYNGFWELAEEEGRSRVLGGIHFTFELDAAEESCVKVGDYVVDNYALPVGP